jgi:hypothetical protein
VLSLVFTIRFLAADLSQSLGNFKYHFNCSTCRVFNSHTKSFWHNLIPFLLSPPTGHSLNFDLRVFWLSSWQLSIWHISPSSDFQMNSQLFLASCYIAFGRNSKKTRPLPSNGYPLLWHIHWNVFAQQRAVYQESVSTGMCLSSRCLAVGLHVTIWFVAYFTPSPISKNLS